MLSAESVSARTTRFVEGTLNADPRKIRDHLSSRRVTLQMDEAVAGDFVGQAIAFTVLNLLIHLDAYCPTLDVVIPEAERHPLIRLLPPGPFSRSLEEFFSPFEVVNRITFRTKPSDRFTPADLHILISPRAVPDALCAWADGWIAHLNEDAGAGPWDPNIVGASTAAGLVAAEAFKRLLLSIPVTYAIPILPIERLIFSAYDLSLTKGNNPPLPPTVDFNDVIVVGLGGIGSAFIAAASSLPALSGSLTLVDKDKLSATNLNRYLVARPGDEGFKVDICRRALGFHRDVDARQEWFAEFLAEKGDRHELVVVGVDDDKVRRGIQASQPRLVLNGGTSDTGSFRVTRHDYIHGACLSCISRDDLKDNPLEYGLAQILGLDVETVLEYRSSGEPVPESLLREAGVLSAADVLRLGNRPLADIQSRVCGQVPLTADRESEAVSISFLSALPGFLLVGEVVKERAYPKTLRPPLNERANHALLSILGRPHPALLHGFLNKRDICDCTRPAYRRSYERKWPAKA